MSSAIGSSEMRVVIRPLVAPGFEPELIPAQLFKRIFDAFLAALVAADGELRAKPVSSQFFVSHLAFGSCEFGIIEKQKSTGASGGSAVEFFRRCAGRIYRSDYQALLRRPRLMRAFDRIVKAIDPAYVVLVQYNDMELPLDAFFCRQVDRVGRLGESASQTDVWFGGTAIAAFEGRLEEIDYRGPVWKGRLTLSGGETGIECVFDRSRGEDALNPYGNKSVCVTGRAIYTGDSQLPERLEVLTIEERTPVAAAIGIQGSLAPVSGGDWDGGLDYLH
jgi:hypothetical protein